MLCNRQYVGKSKTSFNIRLNNHQKDVRNTKHLPASVHFRKEGQNFIQNAKFTLIELPNEMENVSKPTFKLRLKLGEVFWILKLVTLSQKGLNQELSNLVSPIAALTVHIL